MGALPPIAFVTKLSAATTLGTRTSASTYDGLLRLIGAVERPGSGYEYSYVGNRIWQALNGVETFFSYNAANQLTNAGYSYDLAGNLLTDGTLTYTYDALNRTKTVAGAQSRTYTYNGDGVLVRQVAGATTTDYTQDLAAPLAQVLQTKVGATTTSSLYGLERLASKSGTPRTWYLGDGLGSVRRTLTDAGAATVPVFYDPWGTVESGTVPTFGFTGELQDPAAGLVNLRARWYSTPKGTFTSRDPFAGMAEQPYSLHQYQYGLSDPVLYTDPTGQYAVDDGGQRESRRCPPGIAANPRTGRCGGSGSRSGGSWGDGDTNPTGSDSAGLVTLPAPMTAPEPPLFPLGGMPFQVPPLPVCEIPILIITRGQVEQWQRAAEELNRTLEERSSQPQPQPVTPPPTPNAPTPTPRSMSVFISGNDTRQTTQHIADAIALASKPAVLSYRGRGNPHDRAWLKDQPACQGSNRTQWCDEYPFASTNEGGEANRPSLQLISASEQRIQAGKLSSFYQICKVKVNEVFLVQTSTTQTSGRICKP